MKLIVKEQLDKNNVKQSFHNQPLRYRVTLTKHSGDEVHLTKEYFRSGFLSGETDDKMFISEHSQISAAIHVSLMTQNMDEDYVNSVEDKVFKAFYDQINVQRKINLDEHNTNIKKYKRCENNLDEIFTIPQFSKMALNKKLKKMKRTYDESQGETPTERLRNKLSPFINLISILSREGIGGIAGKQELLDIVNKEIKTCKELTPEILDHLDDIEEFYSGSGVKLQIG